MFGLKSIDRLQSCWVIVNLNWTRDPTQVGQMRREIRKWLSCIIVDRCVKPSTPQHSINCWAHLLTCKMKWGVSVEILTFGRKNGFGSIRYTYYLRCCGCCLLLCSLALNTSCFILLTPHTLRREVSRLSDELDQPLPARDKPAKLLTDDSFVCRSRDANELQFNKSSGVWRRSGSCRND